MLDAATIESLKQKHPGSDLYAIGNGAEAVVVRPPTMAEWKSFRAMAREGGAKSIEASGYLLGLCRLWPEADKYEAILARRPALVDTYSARLAEIAGVDEEVVAKKL